MNKNFIKNEFENDFEEKKRTIQKNYHLSLTKKLKVLEIRHKNYKAIFRKILPIIWLLIIIEFISKIPSQKIDNFKNRIAFLNTFRVKYKKFT